MKKKLYAMRFLKISALVLAVVMFVVIGEQYVFAHFDHNKTRIEAFYLEDKNSIDVMFLGASESYTAFSSDWAYSEFGFTSFPYAVSQNSVVYFKNQLEEILRYQNPKLIVIEVNGALYDNEEMLYNRSTFRWFVDNIKDPVNRILYINEQIPSENRFDYYIPMNKYHDQWKKFPKIIKSGRSKVMLQARGYSLLKGITSTSRIYKAKTDYINVDDDDSALELYATAEEKLRDFLQYCKDKNIDNILFVRYPRGITKVNYKTFQRSNKVGDIISEYGYDYINFDRQKTDIGIDYDTDFYNQDHLNIYGCKKFTSYLGKIISEDYKIAPSNLTQSQKKKWDLSAMYMDKMYEYCVENINNHKSESVSESYELIKKLESIDS